MWTVVPPARAFLERGQSCVGALELDRRHWFGSGPMRRSLIPFLQGTQSRAHDETPRTGQSIGGGCNSAAAARTARQCTRSGNCVCESLRKRNMGANGIAITCKTLIIKQLEYTRCASGSTWRPQLILSIDIKAILSGNAAAATGILIPSHASLPC